ncbi:SPFH domain / Band 7 family protein [Aquisphaera giovannonii]|uniref:SPFH domain / Band 7 family protein n=1 Tax=Aquisphaera giovannonii TaxID=406548 RepID=A0A5B9WDM3_9BACT|nr:SPFH domain-containing protein [Aquisphaera giovannonii]QEH38061.1 SPFH domain / Band 7 family protein [Aquisphaera giovannonii]
MPFLGYFKGQPTEHVIRYSSGRIAREGQGLAFFYLKYNTQLVVVPTSSMDANLVFNEVTSNFQTVTIQGQFTYRIHNPRKAAELLNFTMDPATHRHLSNDPDRLAQRITNIIQMETRTEIQKRSLEEVLTQYESIAGSVQGRIKGSSLLDPLGVELLSVYFVAAKPTPEVAKALEAEYRENLLQKADYAISARRAAAVEEERKIKENELNTEIALEQQRRRLIDLQGENELRQANHRGQAAEEEAAYQNRVKQRELALYQGIDPRKVLALALSGLGENAGRIGNLTITSEILASLLDAKDAAASSESSPMA